MMCHTKATEGFDFRHLHSAHKLYRFGHKMFQRWRTFMPYTLEATDMEYIIKMPLPGHDVKDIEVSAKKNYILIETRKQAQTSPEDEIKENKTRKIRSFGEFLWNKQHVEVMIPVDDEIDPETVKAKFSRGILMITFNKRPGTKIDIEE